MHTFTLESSIEEMDEGDLRATLGEFMDKHDENVSDYQALEADRDAFNEKVEDLEAQVDAFAETQDALTETFAARVASETPLFDAEEVAERFSLEELLAKADDLGVFSVPDPEGETDEPTFADKPDRAPTGEGTDSEFAAQVEDDLSTILGGF